MALAAVACSVVGAVLGFAAALWAFLGFKPEDYQDDGMLYPGEQVSTVVPRLLRDQQKVGALIVASAALQLLGVALGLIA